MPETEMVSDRLFNRRGLSVARRLIIAAVVFLVVAAVFTVWVLYEVLALPQG